jgi:hypothetical protein
MTRLRERLVSLPLLVGVSIAGLACEMAAVYPLSRFIRESSTDIVVNFQLTLLFTLLIGLVSAVWLALCIRLLWGAEALWPQTSLDASSAEQEFFSSSKHMRATTTKKGIFFVAIVLAQMMLFDYLAQGAFVLNTKENMVLTGLRSPRGEDRERVLDDAVLMGASPAITKALGQVMTRPGPARHWAAWAAGVRRETSLEQELLALSRSEVPDEVAASITALSRISAVSVVSAVEEVLPRLKERRGDLLAALGDLGKRALDAHPAERERAVALLRKVVFGTDAVSLERHLAIWALGRIEAAEVLAELEEMLSPASDVATLCVASSALANIGAADTSPKMLALTWTIGTEATCPPLVFFDYSNRQTLLSEEKPVQLRLLTDIALIGDRRAIPELERMAGGDPRIQPRAQAAAKEIAYAMRVAKRK